MPEEQPKQPALDFNKLEQDMLRFWDENGIFKKSLEKTKDGQPYIFYDGPPFATGLPHYGSILPSVIKDAIPRYQTMKGRYVRRRWGWDCHGLPIENMVEKNLKISGKKQIEEIGVARFNQVCRDNVLMYSQEWGKVIHRIARWVEFDNSYKTMDTTYQESVWWGLKQVWEKGLIYEDRKVLLYCSRCETPISNFEVAMDNSYRDITEESVYAKFKLLKGQRIVNDLTDDRTYMLAWTTTPWTLPGNTSLNLGADIAYVLIEHEDGQRYILAKDRLSIVDGQYEIVAEYGARSLEGLEYEPLFPGVIPNGRDASVTSSVASSDSNPLPPPSAGYSPLSGGDAPQLSGDGHGASFPFQGKVAAQQTEGLESGIIGNPARAHKVYLADFVTTTDGTGIVHNAALYGEEDYQLAKDKDLPRADMLDHKGKYLDQQNIPVHLRGVFFKDADKIIIDELRGNGLLYKSEHYTHSYPHCYRCGTPLFYNALPAWFINIQKIKQQLIENNASINWYPEHLKFGRFQQGIENAPDWNISRNRYWATALPFWKCGKPECKNITCIGSVAELIERSTNFSEVYPHFDVGAVRPGGRPQGSGGQARPLLNLETLDLHKPYIDEIKLKCEQCGSEMRRVPEVVDCWVESGSMPFAELHYPFEHDAEGRGNSNRINEWDELTNNHVGVGAGHGLPGNMAENITPQLPLMTRGGDPEDFQNRFPADFVVEYIPQTRAWFYVMHVVSTMLFGEAPFKNVMTTGTILGEDGTKMSKSKGNYPDANLVIEKYGADALRFYLLTNPVVLGEDVNFSERNVQEVNRKLSLIFYNIWTFYRMYERGQIINDKLQISNDKLQIINDKLQISTATHVLDKWVMARLNQVIQNVTGYMDGYNTVKAGKEILEFVNDVSTWYVRRSRERIKSGDVGNGLDRSSSADGYSPVPTAGDALRTLGYVLAQTSKLLAPFMPFLSDFIYKDVTGQESVHLESWPVEADADKQVLDEMAALRQIVETGLGLRKDSNLKVRQPLAELEYHITNNQLLSPELEKVLAEELNVKTVSDRGDFGPKNGWAYRETPDFKLSICTELTPELKAEGLARELERLIQDLRKKSSLKVGDLVDVYYNSLDEEIEEILLKLVDRKKTFINQISRNLEVEVDFETQGEIEGKKVWVGLVKI